MAWDLGDVIPLSITITNASGILENATSVTLSIDQPDGTALSVGIITPASTGIYNYDYVPAQYGRHNVRWLATRSEEHTSELQSRVDISYAVFCLKKKQTPPRLRRGQPHLDLDGASAMRVVS